VKQRRREASLQSSAHARAHDCLFTLHSAHDCLFALHSAHDCLFTLHSAHDCIFTLHQGSSLFTKALQPSLFSLQQGSSLFSQGLQEALHRRSSQRIFTIDNNERSNARQHITRSLRWGGMLWRTTIIFYFFHFRRFVFAPSLSPSPVCLFAFGSLSSTPPLISMTGRWPQ
jgi:hypothetical protein